MKMCGQLLFCSVMFDMLLYLLILTCLSGIHGCKTDKECVMGVCQNTSTCLCLPSSALDSNGACSINRVSKYVGILQFLAPFGFGGIGNLILKYTLRGWVQFVFTLQGYVLLALLYAPKRKVLTLILAMFAISVIIFVYLTGVIWSIADGIIILTGATPDANMVATY